MRSLSAWQPTAERSIAILGCGLALLLDAGCGSVPYLSTAASERMRKQPDACRRVNVLPIWLACKAEEDETLTSDDLRSLKAAAGTNLVLALRHTLERKGYDIVQTGPLASDYQPRSGEAGQALAEAWSHFSEMDHTIQNVPIRFGKMGRGVREVRVNPPVYTVDSSITKLPQELGLDEADLLVLIDSTLFFESPAQSARRTKWNWTWGPLLTPVSLVTTGLTPGPGGGLPLAPSPCWIKHTTLVVNAHTREVIFWNRRKFPDDALKYPGEDARTPGALEGTLKKLLADLPALPK